MAQDYETERWVWTEDDFERMGWHDCRIHALAFSPETFELLLDLDYLLEWIRPSPPERYFRFWTAPATLVFENVYEIEFDIGSSGTLEMDGIKREDARRPHNADFIGRETEWLWSIDCQEGQIRLRSVGFKQYIRSAPRFGRSQRLELSERGGYSFATTRTDENE